MSGANARRCSGPQSQSASRDVWQTLMRIADSVESQAAEHVPDIFDLSSVCPTHDVKVCPDLVRALAFADVRRMLTYDVC